MCRFNIILFVGMFLLHLSLYSLSYAETELDKKIAEQVTKTVDERYKNTESKLETNLQKHIDAKTSKILDDQFKEAASRLENQADRHFESMNKVFDDTHESFKWLISCASGVLIVLAGIGAVLLLGHNKNIREHIKEEFEQTQKNLHNKIEKLEQQYEQKMVELRVSLHEFEQMKDFYKQALKESEELKKKYEDLTAYKHKKIVWALETSKIDASSEVADIREENFEVYECPEKKESSLPKNQYALMIYSYCKSEKSIERLNKIVNLLKSTQGYIPLIIYTYNSENLSLRLDEEELNILRDYRNYYVIANMPLTLKSYFNSLIRTEKATVFKSF